MSYKRFKPSTGHQTVANVATVAGVPRPYTALARTPSTAKINNNNNIYNKGLHHFEPVSLSKNAAEPPAPISAYADRGPATVANFATVCETPPPPICAGTPATVAAVATLPAYRAALAKFKEHRPHGVTRLRHDQACSAAEMFLDEWEAIAAEFGWLVDDIFARDGLAWWLGVELVTALGPSTPSLKQGASLTA